MAMTRSQLMAYQKRLCSVKKLTAKKLVVQADSQVSCNPRTAFPYADVMVSLMNTNSELRDLILAYFYIQYPYLLPYYPAKQPEQSTEEEMKRTYKGKEMW